MRIESEMMGGLSCRVFDDLPDGDQPQWAVILCHGFGAPGDDLVPLGPELLRLAPALAGVARFVFPAAPVSMDAHGLYGGRAWWLLNFDERLQAIQRGELRELCSTTPEGMPEVSKMLTELVGDVRQAWDVPYDRIALGGFSQGSMLATDVALALPERTAGLCIFSGTLLREAEWQGSAEQRGPLPVFQSHGRQDPLLPYLAAEWLRNLLTSAGLQVEFLPFDGMHTIPGEALQRFSQMLCNLTGA